jgi:hypothetical protein
MTEDALNNAIAVVRKAGYELITREAYETALAQVIGADAVRDFLDVDARPHGQHDHVCPDMIRRLLDGKEAEEK